MRCNLREQTTQEDPTSAVHVPVHSETGSVPNRGRAGKVLLDATVPAPDFAGVRLVHLDHPAPRYQASPLPDGTDPAVAYGLGIGLPSQVGVDVVAKLPDSVAVEGDFALGSTAPQPLRTQPQMLCCLAARQMDHTGTLLLCRMIVAERALDFTVSKERPSG